MSKLLDSLCPLNPTVPRIHSVSTYWKFLGLPASKIKCRLTPSQHEAKKAQRRLRLSVEANREKNRATSHLSYIRNLEERRKKGTEQHRERKAWLDAIKAATPCTDCGGFFHPVCMDYDHVRGEKVSNVSWLATKVGKEGKALALEEIEKCELVCANCHRLRTLNRPQKNRKYGKNLAN